jgi:hypothetical protein
MHNALGSIPSRQNRRLRQLGYSKVENFPGHSALCGQVGFESR